MNSPAIVFTFRHWKVSWILSRALLVGLIVRAITFSQLSTKVASFSPTSVSPHLPFRVTVALQQGETIERVFLAYRPFGSSEYNRTEMDIVGNTASTTIPAHNVLPPFVECYLVLQDRAGRLESYPLSENDDPFDNPPTRTIQIRVSPEEETGQEITFLSPEPGARVTIEDLLISVSLLRADSMVVKRATQFFLDGADISSKAVVSDDIIVISPENAGLTIHPGLHRLTVRLFRRDGYLHKSETITFTVAGLPGTERESPDEWKYNSSIQLESRHEDVSSVGTWYNRANILLSGSTGDWRFNGNVFITSDEKADRQPQNRYFISADLPWARLGYGDAYPSFPSLVLSGKRVRGLVSALRLGWFNLDLSLGKTSRAVDGSLLKVIGSDTLGLEQMRDPNAAYAEIDSAHWGKFSYGTFGRNLFAVRPSFGSGEYWQFGLTWLKSKDDVSSIRYGIRPQENFVLGTDFVARFDNKRIDLSGQGAFSAFNNDISSGDFTDAYIDSVYPNDADQIKRARDILKNVITVNDNLSPLKLNKPSTLAYDMGLEMKYFGNAFKLSYLFRGSNYNSFGQTFLRKDIQGFNISDRVRLADNRVLATGAVELLRDNTSDSKIATTSFTNLNFAVSYYPDPEYPNVTVGFSSYGSDNGLPIAGPDSSSAINDATNRFFVQSSYDFDLSARHTATFSLSTSSRNDRSVRQYDVKSFTVSLGLSTRYTIPLETSVDLSINTNSLPSATIPFGSQSFDYTTLSINARYAVVRDIFSVRISAGPTFGDFKRAAYDLGATWNAMPTMTIELQFSLFDNSGLSKDTIWSLRYRYDV